MLTFTDFSKSNEGRSYWLPPENTHYVCAYFPKEKSEKKTFSLEEAYRAGGSIAFFLVGTVGSDFQGFREKAEETVSTEGDRSYIWVDDRKAEWELQSITEAGGKIEADILLDIGGYVFSLYVSGKSVKTQCLGERIQFTSSLSGQIYPPGEDSVNVQISGIDFSGITQAGSFFVNISYLSGKNFWQTLGVEMRYFYTSDATLQETESFRFLPLAESSDSFSLGGQIHPFRPLNIETTFLRPEHYSKALTESNFSFTDGSPVCFWTGDITIGFEKTIPIASEAEQFYFSLKDKARAASRTESEGKNTFLHDDYSPNELSLLLSMDGGQSLSLKEEELYFHFVDKPSFAVAKTTEDGGLAELEDRCMAPWIAIRQKKGDPPEYYRHPAGMCAYDTEQESPSYEGYPERELLYSELDEEAFPLLPNLMVSENETESSVGLLESAVVSPFRSQILKQTGIAPQQRGRKSRGGKICVTGGYAYMQKKTAQRAPLAGEGETGRIASTEKEREAEAFTWLGFGDEDGVTSAGEIPLLAFSHVHGDLKSAFSEEEPFLVMTEEKEVKECSSLTYRLTEERMTQIQNSDKLTSRVKEDLGTYFAANAHLYGRQFEDEASFEEILAKASKALDEGAVRIIETICAGFSFTEGDFEFSLAPFWWKEKGVVLIFKFCRGASLEELATDVSRWSFPAAAGDCMQTKQKILRAIDNARMNKRLGEAFGHTSEYEGFLKVVEDPNFTGILALNCPCVNPETPVCLSEYANLFSISDLCASYAVITCSHAEKTENEGVRFFSDIQTLIICESLKKSVEAPQEGFAFSPTELFLQLQNGKITGKRIHASLYLDTLFSGSLALPAGGNTSRFCGTGQVQGGVFRYELSSFTDTEYYLSDSPLDSVEISQVSFVLSAMKEKTKAVYTLSGRLRFRNQEDFDVYSYGRDNAKDSYLSFSGLVYTVITDQESGKQTILREMGGFRIREGGEAPRNGSFAERFPVNLKQFLCYEDNPAKILPKDLSYIGIQAPVKQGELSKVWYGTTWVVDLGACGLSPLKGVRLELLTAWGPTEAEGEAAKYFSGISEYVGMRLLAPDGKAFSLEFTLFDALKLKFKTVELKYEKSAEGKKAYWLLFHNFVLQLFALSLPNGSNTLGIYADPAQGGASGKLGWYCAYIK